MNYSFPVIDNHPTMSRHYCEMCGGEVDRKGEPIQSTGVDAKRGDIIAALEILRWAYRLHLNRPQMLTVIGIKVEHPEYTMRDLETYTAVKRSRICDIMREAVEIMPALSPILGLETPKARGQRQRRKQERNEHEQDG